MLIKLNLENNFNKIKKKEKFFNEMGYDLDSDF
jgi:hypothetical protein